MMVLALKEYLSDVHHLGLLDQVLLTESLLIEASILFSMLMVSRAELQARAVKLLKNA